MHTPLISALSAALLSLGITTALAAEAPYYKPANPASANKLTTGHELF